MWEKLPNKGATALPPFEVVIATTSKFLYQYNLTSKKVKAFASSGHGFLKIQIGDLLYTNFTERTDALRSVNSRTLREPCCPCAKRPCTPHASSSISMWRAGCTKSGFCQAIMRKPYHLEQQSGQILGAEYSKLALRRFSLKHGSSVQAISPRRRVIFDTARPSQGLCIWKVEWRPRGGLSECIRTHVQATRDIQNKIKIYFTLTVKILMLY